MIYTKNYPIMNFSFRLSVKPIRITDIPDIGQKRIYIGTSPQETQVGWVISRLRGDWAGNSLTTTCQHMFYQLIHLARLVCGLQGCKLYYRISDTFLSYTFYYPIPYFFSGKVYYRMSFLVYPIPITILFYETL